MSNVLVLGFGNLGFATAKHLSNSGNNVHVYDTDNSKLTTSRLKAAAVKSYNPDLGLSLFDYAFVCTSVFSKDDISDVLAPFVVELAPIKTLVIRSTLPPESFKERTELQCEVVYWPEFMHERGLADGKIAFHRVFGSDKMLGPDALEYVLDYVPESQCMSFDQAIYWKLLWNAKRAYDVHFTNYAARCFEQAGASDVKALTEQFAYFHYHEMGPATVPSLQFAGSCLEKDLNFLLDGSFVHNELNSELLQSNQIEYRLLPSVLTSVLKRKVEFTKWSEASIVGLGYHVASTKPSAHGSASLLLRRYIAYSTSKKKLTLFDSVKNIDEFKKLHSNSLEVVPKTKQYKAPEVLILLQLDDRLEAMIKTYIRSLKAAPEEKSPTPKQLCIVDAAWVLNEAKRKAWQKYAGKVQLLFTTLQ